MAYRIEIGEPLGSAVKRIAQELLRDTQERLSSAGIATIAKAVHESRKNMKKARAAFRLMRPCIPSSEFKHWNRELRDLGQELSDLRDAQIFKETLPGLLGRGKSPRRILERLQGVRKLTHRPTDAAPPRHPGTLAVAAALARANRLIPELKQWTAPALEDNGFPDGARRTYRQARKALRECRKRASPENIHELRKRVKDAWYHAQLLQPMYPKKLGQRIANLDQLSDMLGTHHDLHVIAAKVEACGPLAKSDQQIVRRIARKQQALEKRSLPLAARLFAESPSKYADRLGQPRQRRSLRSSSLRRR